MLIPWMGASKFLRISAAAQLCQFFIFPLHLKQALVTLLNKNCPFGAILKNFGGERGIRTLDTLLRYTHFPGVPLQPLEHLSKINPLLSIKLLKGEQKYNNYFRLKTSTALAVVILATSSTSFPVKTANFSTTYFK